MYILIDRNTLEVIATIGAKEDIVKDPYELFDLGDKEPTFENKDGKLVFNGLLIKGGSYGRVYRKRKCEKLNRSCNRR